MIIMRMRAFESIKVKCFVCAFDSDIDWKGFV